MQVIGQGTAPQERWAKRSPEGKAHAPQTAIALPALPLAIDNIVLCCAFHLHDCEQPGCLLASGLLFFQIAYQSSVEHISVRKDAYYSFFIIRIYCFLF
ncbi:hypothetical protein SAMD00079811_11780 [Scytonema sp. HK-05]|nr:hypothetical protein SAMD00079811_11780 [Scytonema sp. HK-05]